MSFYSQTKDSLSLCPIQPEDSHVLFAPLDKLPNTIIMARHNPLLLSSLVDSLQDAHREAEALHYLEQVPKHANLPLIGYSFFTPLLYSAYLGRVRLVTYLLTKLDAEHIRAEDNYGRNALLNAVISGDIGCVELLATHLHPTSMDRHRNTALHLAAAQPKLLSRLLLYGLDPNSLNLHKVTPLHCAAEESELGVRVLVEAGARLDSQDFDLWTPLHHAVYAGRLDTVKALLELGADLTITEKSGLTPLDFAKSDPEMTALIHHFDPRTSPILSSSNHPDFQPSLELAPLDAIRPPLVENIVKPLVQEVESIGGTISKEPPIESHASLSAIVRKNQSSLSIDLDSLTKYGVEIVPYSELTLKEELGRGGYGRVHRGIFRNNTVAVKIVTDRGLSDKMVRDFLKEIECLVKIRHDRFLMLQAICLEGPLCMVTELAKGGNLADALEKGKIEPADKPLIGLQIAQGMAFIHSKNPPIIHRDLKPQNILLDRYKQVKICDLGLSRSVAASAANTFRLESTELFAGTVRYMAPEHFDDNPVISRGTDVWAFGCILSQLFSGKAPWSGLELPAVQRRLLMKTEFPLEKDLDPQVKSLVAACCSLQTAARPKFAEIITKLEAIIGVPSSQLS